MIISSIAAACFAMYMVNVVRWQRILDGKPFNCVVCLSAWAGLAIGLLDGYGWHSLLIMFMAGVAGLILDQGASRYL